MTTQQYLANKGVSMEQAQAFVMDNLDNVENIFNVCKQFGVNNDMLADIVQTSFPGVTGEIVSNFFTSNGFDGNVLGFNLPDDSSTVSGQYETLNLGTGFSAFVEKSVTDISSYGNFTTEYSYTYDSSTNTITQYDESNTPLGKHVYNSQGQVAQEIILDENGNNESISFYTYNTSNQLQAMTQESFQDGISIGSINGTNTWGPNSVTTVMQADYGSYGQFTINSYGEGLNTTNTAPIVSSIDTDSDGVYDERDTYTYDSNGNEVRDEWDENADGVVDETYITDWYMIV